MKNTVLGMMIVLGGLVATEALAQAPVVYDQYGRAYYRVPDAGTPSREARPSTRRARDPYESRAERQVGSFDGAWSVAIITRSGGCDPSYRFGVQIFDGRVVYEGRAAGQGSPGGGVSVASAQGGQQANGHGRPSRGHARGVVCG